MNDWNQPSDTCFKRAFFRSITILGGNLTAKTLSVGGKEILDFTEAGKSLRSAKFEEHLSLELPATVKHGNNVFNTLSAKNETVRNLGENIEQTSSKMQIPHAVEDLKTEKLDNLYNQLLVALQNKDESKIQKLQETILLLSDE